MRFMDGQYDTSAWNYFILLWLWNYDLDVASVPKKETRRSDAGQTQVPYW